VAVAATVRAVAAGQVSVPAELRHLIQRYPHSPEALQARTACASWEFLRAVSPLTSGWRQRLYLHLMVRPVSLVMFGGPVSVVAVNMVPNPRQSCG